MTLDQYIDNINKRYKLGNATEHTFRGDLQQLIESIVPEISATNEPKRQKCGAPDYILMKKDIPVGFIEAKDIGDKDMEGAKKNGNKEQFDRYRASLGNLIFTDYLSFFIYHDAEFVTKVSIATLQFPSSGGVPEGRGGEIIALPENFATFTNLIKDFCARKGQTIKSSKKLAEMMAAKARLLSDVIGKALTNDEEKQEDSTLKDQLEAFKQILIHDITPKGFADVYAQTIAYGMFAARLHDPTLPTFSRQEAAELIPKSNPFLRKLFGYIAGPDLDDRIKWIVDGLIEIFLACNVEEILHNYGKATKMEDPIIHFYETFLSEYDPALRKARGVWYTPHPVVSFQVRAIDEILKTEFDLPQGIADSSKIKIKVNIQGKKVEQEVHRVQILDPATGTATYIAEVIKEIYKKFEGQQGIWSNYVENHLLPRLIGFELLMASYAMAHLQIDLLLKETGYKPTREQRLKIYLTNSLEEGHPDTGTLFANWLSNEANEANHIKRNMPVMIVMGNPPYAVSSTNKGEWIQNLIADYKKDLNERKINLDDDYIKFIRYGQHFIDKNGSGILAYISNNSFIDGVTHRQMRKHLLESFDKIYILDLHGFAKLKGKNIVSNSDENVFDIQQGVSINIFIKNETRSNKKKPIVNYYEKYGTRNEKYDYLTDNNLSSVKWNSLNPIQPYYFFVPKDFSEEDCYNLGFKINDLFLDSNSGVKTDRDNLFYDSNKVELSKRFQSLISGDYNQEFANDYNINDSGSYKITSVIKNKKYDDIYLKKSVYRPFDNNWTYYDPKIISRSAQKVMIHLNGHNNIGLVLGRQGQVIGHMQWNLIFCTKTLIDYNVFYRGGGYVFPLYFYLDKNAQQTIGATTERTPNLNLAIVNEMAEKIGLTFTNEKATPPFGHPSAGGELREFAPIDILDYIYAVLHSPTYREKYKEFLKIDFPRVPYPKDVDTFWQLVKLGGEIRQIHLLESDVVERYITQYPEDGDNVVRKPRFQMYDYNNEIPDENGIIHYPNYLGTVYINDTQYFDNVPELAWNFYIGGYQPAQKWLKDRKERTLEFDDILHYQKIIVALTETDRIMKEIDGIEIE